MKLSMFKFHLPKELLAEYPAKERDQSRLMVVHRKNSKIEHRLFKDILEYFNEGDVFVLNDTKVFPARLYGSKEKTSAKVEVFLLREINAEMKIWDVLVDPARKIRIGNKVYFGNNFELVAEVIDNTTSRGRTLRFLFDGPYEAFRKKLYELGEVPLPKYIKRKPEALDVERYQTVYAKNEGAVAAPTAGLHFSRELLKRMEIKGIQFAPITLHVGLGTFRPVEVEDLYKHKMESEEYIIPASSAKIINDALDHKKQVVAVGSSTARTIESSVSTTGRLNPGMGWTNKFIFPPYQFHIPTALVTNFHTPESTSLMLTAAFGGYDLIMRAYKEAIKEKYRFFSYGDAMLIL